MLRDRRLLVVTESLGIGGTESHLRRLLPRLSASGWEVAVFCLSTVGTHADELKSKGIEVFSTRRLPMASKFGHRHPVFLVRAANSLFAFMRRWNPAIVHFYLPGPYIIGAPMAIINQTPIKVMSRRSLSNYQQRWPTIAKFERRLHQKMDALIGNSRAVVSELLDEDVPERKVRLIYNGVELSEPHADRSEVRQELGLDQRALVGVMVANLIRYKGHQDLIKGLAGIAGQLNMPWRILLVGRDEGLQTELEGLARTGGITDNIQFLGERLDVPNVLAAADFGLLPSHEEGFSNVILEGMAAALPIIATNVGGNPEAVEHEKTGLIVPTCDPHAIGRAVLRLSRDLALRRRLGAAARERVSKTFSMDRCGAAHAKLYEELLTKAEEETATAKASARAKTPPLSAPAYVRPSVRPLMLAYWGRYGALPQLTLELGDACMRLGQDSQTTISVSADNELFDSYRRFGESLFPVNTYASPIGALNLKAVSRLRRRLRERVLADGTRAFVSLMTHIWSPAVAPILRQYGIRHTVIVHDADPHVGDRTALINRWLLREARAATQIVTLTTAVAERLIETKIASEKQIYVLFHPDMKYPPIVRKAISRTEPLRVAFFGRILPYKGLDIFVDSIKALKESSIPICVGVYGAGDLSRQRVELQRLGAEIRNSWISPKEIGEILARQDVIVVSHTKASQSGVIAAAFGAGVPVVATPVGGLREQIVPDVTGVLAADVTVEAVAAAIRRLAENRELLLRIQQRLIATKDDRSVDRFFRELSEIALKDA